jgi:hypothetical protein
VASINPLENDFVLKIKELENRLSAIELARQPYQGDWINLNVGSLAIVGATGVLTFSDRDPREILSIGDRIRLSQTTATPSSYKYLNVIALSLTTVTLLGDALSGNNLYYIDCSKISQPVGFPVEFSYTPTLSLVVDPGDNLTLANVGAVTASYTVLGDFCFYSIDRGAGTAISITGTDGDYGTLYETLPIVRDISQQQEHICGGFGIYDLGLGLVNLTWSFCATFGSSNLAMEMSDYGYGKFTVGAYSYNLQAWYRIVT